MRIMDWSSDVCSSDLLTGVILTRLDGDARGGAALSIHAVTGLPIKYVGVGERLDALEAFHPDRMAGRILDRGDVVSLVESAQEAIDQDEAAKLDDKVGRRGQFDLDDFLTAMKQLNSLGPLEGIPGMLPGVGKQLKGATDDPARTMRIKASMSSMPASQRR